MKFAAITTFLGCSALVVGFAVQSDNLLIQPQTTADCRSIRTILERLHFSLRPAVDTSAAVTPARGGAARSKPEASPLLEKAETLVLIAQAAARHNVPATFIQSIVAAESNFNCAAISPRGAVGLMQLMPETAQQFGADPAIPAQNIDAGTRYLRWLMNRYNKGRSSLKHVIAAYNAGPAMVDRYHGIPPFRETRSYVARVLGYLKQFEGAQRRSGS